MQQPYSVTPGMSTKSRKGRSQNFTALPAGRNNVAFDSFSTFLPSSNTDVYSQFVKRYRNRPQPFYESLDDPESSVYRGAAGFTDDDSDEDGDLDEDVDEELDEDNDEAEGSSPSSRKRRRSSPTGRRIRKRKDPDEEVLDSFSIDAQKC